MKKVLLALGIAGLLLGFGAAGAQAATWHANPGASYDPSTGTVTLDSTNGPTSYETENAGVQINTGDQIRFDYTGPCHAGAPRVYIRVNGTTEYNTFDDPDTTGCNVTNQANDSGGTVVATYDGPSGTIDRLYLVNDSGTPSVNTIRNLTIGTTVVPLGPPPGPPTNKDQCKNGGWQNGPYRNQGECVSTFAKNK